jgi:Xaa-Pro aminopeptidase
MPVVSEEFQQRQQALLAACADLDLGALIVVANGSCFGLSGKSQGYLAYLCGWNSFDSPSALILMSGRSAHLVVSHYRMKMMALETVPDVAVSWIDQDAFGTGICSALAEAGSLPRRVGICGWEDVIAKSWKSVETALSGVELVDVTPRFVPLRAVKSPSQLQMHADAARLCDEMFGLLAGLPVGGRYTFDIKAELECHAKRRGAEFVQHWMTVGSPPDYPRYFQPENRQIPRRGDMLVYGMQILMDGVWGHAVRCFSVGPATERQQHLQTLVVEFQRQFVSLMRPGAAMKDAVRVGFRQTEPVYAAIGSRDGVSMLRLGHGMGYSYGEPGTSDAFPRSYYDLEQELARPVPGTFEAGMLFQIHPQFFYPDGVAGVGDMVAVEAAGARFMTQYPRSIGELHA